MDLEVERETADELVLRKTTSGVNKLLMVMPLLLGAFAVGTVVHRATYQSRITCERPASGGGECRLVESSWLTESVQRVDAGAVRQVRLVEPEAREATLLFVLQEANVKHPIHGGPGVRANVRSRVRSFMDGDGLEEVTLTPTSEPSLWGPLAFTGLAVCFLVVPLHIVRARVNRLLPGR